MLRFHLISLTLLLVLFQFLNVAAKTREEVAIGNDDLFEAGDYFDDSEEDVSAIALSSKEYNKLETQLETWKIIFAKLSKTLLETLEYRNGKRTLKHVANELITVINNDRTQHTMRTVAEEIKDTLSHNIAPQIIIKMAHKIQDLLTKPKGLRRLANMFDFVSIPNGSKTLETFIVGLFQITTKPGNAELIRVCIDEGVNKLKALAPPQKPQLVRQRSKRN